MKTQLMATAVAVLFIVGIVAVPGYTEIDTGACIGVWLFDEGAGDAAVDSANNGNDGTLSGGPEWVDGKLGTALSFDGVDDYVNLPAITSDNWEGLTLLAWVWLRWLPNELPTSWGEILGSGQDLYDMYLDKGTNEFRVKVTTTVGAERPGIPAADLQKDQWLHVAGVYDKTAGQMRVYLNGEVADTHNLTGVINGTQFPSIGAQGGPNGPFTDLHNGLIDEVALLSATLSDEDIQSVMTNGLRESLNIPAAVAVDKLAATWAGIKQPE